MLKLIFFLVLFIPVMVFAQEAAEPGVFPWKDNAMITGIYLAVLGVLSTVVNKIPGKIGQMVQWLVDMLSANVKHK